MNKDRKEYFKNYYLKNKENFLEKQKLYCKNHESYIREYQKEYRKKHNLDNKENIKEYLKKYYLEHKEAYKERCRKYRKTHQNKYTKKNNFIPDVDCEWAKFENYYIYSSGNVYNLYGKEIGKTNNKGYTYVTINRKQWLRHKLVWVSFVGEIPEGYEIDHIIPLKNGGTDALSNLRLVTHKDNCNNKNSIENYKKSNKNK